MPATDKVGSWLGNGGSKAKGEAYDSDSEESSVATNAGGAGGAASDDDDADSVVSDGVDDVAELEDEVTREVNIDWDVVMPKVRAAVLDTSPKRREQFAARYLYVTDESRSCVDWHS